MSAKKTYRFQYYVEGDCEKKLISVLKEQKTLILPGKVEKFNVIQERFSNMQLRTLSNKTIVILVFDTDKGESDMLWENLRMLKKDSRIKAVWCVLQVDNLEDELIRSTDIKEIKELLPCPSNKEFKHYFLIEKRLFEKLRSHSFNFDRIWISHPKNGFREIENAGSMIKLCAKRGNSI